MAKLKYNPESLSGISISGGGVSNDWSKLVDYYGSPTSTSTPTKPTKISTLAELNNYIDGTNTLEGLTIAENNINTLGSVSNNPADAALLMGAQSDVNSKRYLLENYKASLEKAAVMANNFVNYRVEDYRNMSIEDINNNLREIADFESYVYEGNVEEKKFNKFIGYHNSGGMNDKQIINRMDEYKKTLKTTLEALYNDGIIQDHEVFRVLTGDTEGLENDIKDNSKRITNNIKTKTSSVNAIKNHMKSLVNSLARSDIKSTDSAVGQVIISTGDGAALVDEVSKNLITTDGSRFSGMDLSDAITQFGAELSNMTYEQVLQVFNNEIASLEASIEGENNNFRKWTGRNFSYSDDNKDAIVDKQIKDVLGSYYQDLSPTELAEKEIKDTKEADLMIRYGTADPKEIEKILLDEKITEMKSKSIESPEFKDLGTSKIKELEELETTRDIGDKVPDVKFSEALGSDATARGFNNTATTFRYFNLDKTSLDKVTNRGNPLQFASIMHMGIGEFRKRLNKVNADRFFGNPSREQNIKIKSLIKKLKTLEKFDTSPYGKGSRNVIKATEAEEKQLREMIMSEYNDIINGFLSSVDDNKAEKLRKRFSK